jgi:hypothetical protein
MKKGLFTVLLLSFFVACTEKELNHDEELRSILLGRRWAMMSGERQEYVQGYYYFIDEATLEWYGSDNKGVYVFSSPGVIDAGEDNFKRIFSNPYRIEDNILKIGARETIDRHLTIVDSYTLHSGDTLTFCKIVEFKC